MGIDKVTNRRPFSILLIVLALPPPPPPYKIKSDFLLIRFKSYSRMIIDNSS